MHSATPLEVWRELGRQDAGWRGILTESPIRR